MTTRTGDRFAARARSFMFFFSDAAPGRHTVAMQWETPLPATVSMNAWSMAVRHG